MFGNTTNKSQSFSTSQSAGAVPAWQNNKLVAAVKKDPQKAFILTVLTVVLLIMWARMAMKSKGAPKSAGAALASAPTTDVIGSTVTTPAIGNLETSQNKAAGEALLEWMRTPITPMTRNVFQIKLDYYPQDASRINQTLRKPEGDGFWDELAKSMLREADHKKERQLLLENLRLRAAQDLKLQTTMMGAKPKALINGELVREGEVVASFRVLKIEARRVIIEREGIKLELLMK